ncbi:HipA domain-containing protein [Jannaschia pohangensis]|uniref:HipA domain-containing protein n=1 Tax=Jannaschia pohangensis TaxID=390807 RepID=UPI002481A446|nr:HipA domain-containing protein [Jannaschia pohangensis]
MISIPGDGAPSTWILKPNAANFPGGVYNEPLCLRLAALIGRAAGASGARRYLLVKRYDRRQQGDSWRRLHREDMRHILGRLPSATYECNNTGAAGPHGPRLCRRDA